MDDQRFIQLNRALKPIFDAQRKKPVEEIPDGCRKVRKIICTPTRILLLPPELIRENRVLRLFGEEYAIRVSFRDDDFSKLSQAFDESSLEFYKSTIITPMTKGIKIGPRHYQFFAWSNSQLCDHGCWIYAKDANGNTASSIRLDMGDLEELRCHNRCVATYMARLGQCFSQTKESIKIPIGQEVVKKIGDILRWNSIKDETYCFSDGIGKISLELREEVCKALHITREPRPSAFQMRFSGCKGMLAVDGSLPGRQMCIRNSMDKFQSTHSTLEVVKFSQPGKLYLNRNVITILSQLGVDDSIFFKMQERVLNMIADSFLTVEGAVKQLSKSVHIGMNFEKIAHCGFSINRDVLFHGMLEVVGRHTFGNLRRRARIELPFDTSRNMFGVLDEYSVLKEGEVFIQYSESFSDERTTLKTVNGTVVVTKNPSMHPGDVRKFEAISNFPKDCPIWLLCDVIVFPQKGKRPHPNEMAGSDLDGDEYFITWEPDLIFSKHNQMPMDFPPASKVKIDRPVEEPDMIEFLMRFIMNDRKGVIANAHMVHADRQKEGIYSKPCLSIVKKYSLAVDFQKTGNCPKLDQDEIPFQYPDFMGKRDKTSYTSNNILGKIFRICREIENVIPRKQKRQLQGLRIAETKDSDLTLNTLDDATFESAKDALQQYNSQLQSMLSQYGIESEFEAVSGCILKLHRRLMEREDTRETEEIIRLRMKNLWRRTRKMFFEEFGGEKSMSKNDFSNEILHKAKVWYTVTNTAGSSLVSFPWVVWDILCMVKVHANAARGNRMYSNSTPTMIDHIQSQIIKAYTESYQNTRKDDIIRSASSYTLRENLFKYFNTYTQLIPLVCNLTEWAKRSKVCIIADHYSGTSISELLFCLLIISIAVQQGCIQNINKVENDCQSKGNIASFSKVCVAEVCLAVLRYMGSVEFWGHNEYIITVVKGFCLNQQQIRHIHKKARRAYHAIAQSGDIGVFTDTSDDHMESKLISDVMAIPVGLAKFLTHRKHASGHRSRIISRTGVERLGIWVSSPTGKQQGVVECTGTLQAIDRLKALIGGWLDKKNKSNMWKDIVTSVGGSFEYD